VRPRALKSGKPAEAKQQHHSWVQDGRRAGLTWERLSLCVGGAKAFFVLLGKLAFAQQGFDPKEVKQIGNQ
jgi:hypothetical protein